MPDRRSRAPPHGSLAARGPRVALTIQTTIPTTILKLSAVAALLGLIGLAPLNAQEAPYAGRSLISVVTEIENRGLQVYYSSDLVRPWMTVKAEPQAKNDRELLIQILDPYGLTLEPGPQDSVLIVRKAEADKSDTGSILGVLREAGSGRRISGATLEIDSGGERTVTSARGHFSFRGLEPGWHTVRVLKNEAGAAAGKASVEVKPGRTSVVQMNVDTPNIWQLGSVVVNASRYDLAQRGPASSYFMPVEQIEQLPDLGDDPLRAIARLPGAATNGWSAKSHIRGGETDENLVLFDGMRLRNPFHLKDFQSVFSAIDPATIEGMDVYTGGVPVVYGDRMSGVIDIQSLEPPVGKQNEISQSLYNTSAMTAGSTEDGRIDWLVSGRRGNLDLVIDLIDSSIGDPKYFDVYSRFGVQATNNLRVTGNVLLFDDNITLSDTDSEEQAKAKYRDAYYWVRLDHEPTLDLRGWTILSHTHIYSRRSGTTDKDGVSTGNLTDNRSFNIESLESNWEWGVNEALQLSAGGGITVSDGDYDFSDEIEYDLLFFELSLVRSRAAPLGWWLGYSWSEVKDDVPGQKLRRAWDQRNAINGGLDWNTDRWNVSLAASYHDGWRTTGVELAQAEPIGLVATQTRNDESVGKYITVDARVAREFKLPNSTLTAFLEVTNVFNRNNDCCVQYELEQPEVGDDPPDLALEKRAIFRPCHRSPLSGASSA